MFRTRTLYFLGSIARNRAVFRLARRRSQSDRVDLCWHRRSFLCDIKHAVPAGFSSTGMTVSSYNANLNEKSMPKNDRYAPGDLHAAHKHYYLDAADQNDDKTLRQVIYSTTVLKSSHPIQPLYKQNPFTHISDLIEIEI